jgi:hypothetical protein
MSVKVGEYTKVEMTGALLSSPPPPHEVMLTRNPHIMAKTGK